MSKFGDKIAAEPVRFWTTLTAFVTALIGVVIGFGIIEFTQEQVGLLLVVWAAIGGMFQFFYVRNQVTPSQ